MLIQPPCSPQQSKKPADEVPSPGWMDDGRMMDGQMDGKAGGEQTVGGRDEGEGSIQVLEEETVQNVLGRKHTFGPEHFKIKAWIS